MSKYKNMNAAKSHRWVDLLLTLSVMFLISSFISCEENEPIETVDYQEIWESDSLTIDNYIKENSLDPVFTTASGARYSIQSVGEGDSINYNDLITINYTAYDADGVVFKSTITPDASQYYIYPIYDPLTFTYTSSGWTLEYTSLFASLQGNGLSEAISAALVNMKTGGQVVVLLPSALGFGSSSDPSNIISTYSVLRYEVSPLYVR
jgi:hypothetical protein|tara:strand:+ start:6042 stop:6662 length:621 start_codon:yes stop_codon:yes gene_type:complete